MYYGEHGVERRASEEREREREKRLYSRPHTVGHVGGRGQEEGGGRVSVAAQFVRIAVGLRLLDANALAMLQEHNRSSLRKTVLLERRSS